MPRFVILCHDSPRGIHFDFMFEWGGVLKTWALPQSPQPGLEMPCQALADHRLAYLDNEGPIAGDRGSVTRWDHGTCTIERQSDAEWVLDLAGEQIRGRAILRRPADDSHRWVFFLTRRTTDHTDSCSGYGFRCSVVPAT